MAPRLLAAAAAGLGMVVVLSGVPPLNTGADVLAIGAAPWRVVLMPAVVIGVISLAAGALYRRRPARLAAGRLLGAGAAALLAGALLSLLESDDVWHSFLLLVLAVAAPAATAVGIATSRVRAAAILAGLLAGVVLAALRADLVVLQTYGFPDTGVLYQMKYASSSNYGFHYYLFNNPTGSAAFLLMPFTVAAFWLPQPGLPRAGRLALLGALALVGATLVLVYSRSVLVLAAALLVAIGLLLPLPRRLRIAAVVAVALGVAAFFIPEGNRTYFTSALSVATNTSGEERWLSIVDGVEALAEAPLTGVGLGRFNEQNGVVAAHSSAVQAGAETGFVGLVGYMLLWAGAAVALVHHVRRAGWFGPPQAAAAAATVYLAYGFVADGANESLYSGYTVVWGLTLAVLLGLAARSPDGPAPAAAPVAAPS